MTTKTKEKTKLILQKTQNDCGIAALAMLYNTTYTKMRGIIMTLSKLAGEPFDGTPSHLAQCVALLSGNKLRVERIKHPTQENLRARYKHRPAVFVVPAKGYPKGTEYHAVYWDGYKIYDPSGPNGFHSDGRVVFRRLEEVWLPM